MQLHLLCCSSTSSSTMAQKNMAVMGLARAYAHSQIVAPVFTIVIRDLFIARTREKNEWNSVLYGICKENGVVC